MTDTGGNYEYRSKISELIATEGKSLTVDFEDLLKYNNDLANKILLEPDSALEAFRRAAYETMRSENALYADRTRKVLSVRVRNIPDRIPLRKVDTAYLDKMIAVAGMVVRTSELRPLLVEGAFVCPNGHVTIQVQDDLALKKPFKCETCEESRNLDLDNKLSRFIDFQILRVQELPEELPPGHLPQFFDVNVEGDITNIARPGDRVVLTGIVRAVPDYSPGQGRIRLFKSQIDCSHIEVIGKEPEHLQITKDDEALIKSVAASADAYNKLINSIAPAILGHLPEREAILLLLAGGAAKALPDGTKLRGDINILLVGDPGVAKSEMLKFAAQVAPRGIFASGRGTSLDYDQPVIIRKAGTVRIAKIGEIVDNEYLPGSSGVFVPASDLECLSYHAARGKVDWTPVSYVYRHRYDKPLLNLRLQTGREIVVTDEHSLYALRDGRLKAVAGKEIRPGDCLAIPGRMPSTFEQGPVGSLFPRDLLTDSHLARLLGFYVAEGYLHEGRKKGKESYRIHFELNEDEVWISNEIRECSLSLFQKGVGVRKHRDSHGITVTISSKKAFRLFKDVLAVSQGAKKERVPTIVFNMPRELQLDFLRAYLEGDRGVTSSRYLISDLLYLVSISLRKTAKFTVGRPSTGSIGGRVFSGGPSYRLKAPYPYRIERPIKPLGPPLKEVLPPFELLLRSARSGQSFIRGQGYKRLTKLLLARLMTGRRLRRFALLRTMENVQKIASADLARELGIGRRNAKQILLRCERSGLVHLSMENRRLYASMTPKGRDAISEIEEVQNIANSDLEFAEVRSINRVKSTSPYVYDLSVKGTENFVAGFGGVLCHNTAAGLSAAVIREKNVLMLEAGVVVLADQGIASIDEFDKMRPEDRSALHEQMEQQTITIAKGGIYATLNARTAILAATNPLLGKYNPYQNLTDNINLPIPLLSRFDLIFVIKDTPTPAEDEKLASHILAVHRKMGYNVPPPIEFKLLKKYLAYAKKITPILTKEAEGRIKEYYLDLRRRGGEGTIGATPRTLESLIRLATARAKVVLRDQVLEEDSLTAIALMNKMVEDVLTDTATKTKADFGVLLGRPAGERSKLTTALEVLKALEGAERRAVERKLFKDELVKSGKFTDEDAEKMIRTMFKEGIIYESKPGFFRRVGS